MALLSPAQMIDYGNAERRRHPAIYREVPSSRQTGPVETDIIFLRELLSSTQQSRYMELEQAFLALRDQLAALRLLGGNWDSYGAPAPNEVALRAADAALRTMRAMNVLPARILPSADGGVGILFAERDQSAHIEFENSGDIWALTYGPNSPPTTWQLPSGNAAWLREAWDRISASLQS